MAILLTLVSGAAAGEPTVTTVLPPPAAVASEPTDIRATVVSLAPAGDETQVASGPNYTCAVTAGGGVKCWGGGLTLYNAATGTAGTWLVPVVVSKHVDGVTSPLDDVRSVSGGTSTVCAVTNGGNVFCWGGNTDGQVGIDLVSPSLPTARRVVAKSGVTTPLTGAVDVAVGYGHACAVLEGGAVRCWGRNDMGQLGTGTTSSTDSPAPVTTLFGDARDDGSAGSLSAGTMHTCAVTSSTSGKVYCWGRNDGTGAAGDPSAIYVTVPGPVKSTNGTVYVGAVAVAAGAEHSCALKADGGIDCWGSRDYGQLGDGIADNQSRSIPKPVIAGPGETAPLVGAIAIASGASHICARLADGSARCWGRNDNGQLGTIVQPGNSQAAPLPVIDRDQGSDPITGQIPVTPLTGVLAVTAGGNDIGNPSPNHTCVVILGRGLRCFGSNQGGQAGNGTKATTVGFARVVDVVNGSVSFKRQGEPLGVAPVAGGEAVLSTAGLLVGANQITAEYAPAAPSTFDPSVSAAVAVAAVGSAAAETVAGTDGDDVQDAAGGDDTFTAGPGNDALAGGDGTDTVAYPGPRQRFEVKAGSNGSFTVTDRAAGSPFGADTLAGIEQVSFGDGPAGPIAEDGNNAAPWLTVTLPAKIKAGQTVAGSADATDPDGDADLVFSADPQPTAGAIAVNPATGAFDYAAPDDGRTTDVLHLAATDPWGGTGTMTIPVDIGANLTVGIDGSAKGGGGDDAIQGSGAADLLLGGGGSDDLAGGEADDSLIGGDGDDDLDGGAGGDVMVGGPGDDTFAVEDPADVVVELANQGLDRVNASVSYTLPAHVEHLTLTGAGPLSGSGNALANRIEGNGGANVLLGGAGDDLIAGGGGDDVVEGGAGKDSLDGGAGTDTLSLAGSPAGVAADLAKGTAADDMVTGFEAIAGSAFADVLAGNGGPNSIEGGAGDDRIAGGAGADRLAGGPGADILALGPGADVAVYRALSESAAARPDTIADLSVAGGDRIDISAVDARPTAKGMQRFTVFRGGRPFSGRAGELRVRAFKGGLDLIGDGNGDKKADFRIVLKGLTALPASALKLK